MNLKPTRVSVLLFILLLGYVNQARAQETKLKWFGHAAFSITTPNGKVLLIDPWLGNPTNPELAGNLVKLADFPAKQAQTDDIMGIGGEIQIADGEVTVAMTPAIHSSSVFNPKAGPNEAERAYGGNPAGFVVAIKNGPTFYHSGDTAYFKDMETIGESYSIDVALLNIGGHFGMEPRMAAKAAQSVRAKLAIPHHFRTFPGIVQKADGFAAELQRLKIGFYEMKPGETISFRGKQLVKAK